MSKSFDPSKAPSRHEELLAKGLGRGANKPESMSHAPRSLPASEKLASDGETAPVLCLLGGIDKRIFGRTTSERLKIQFRRSGISRLIGPDSAPAHNGPMIVVRNNAVIDQPLIPILAQTPDLLLLAASSDGEIPIAAHLPPGTFHSVAPVLMGETHSLPHKNFRLARPADLGASFWQGLRKREVPYAFLLDARNRTAVEWRMFMGTYKGATDIITKRLWPYPAFLVTRALAATRISPNLVTACGALLVFIAFFLFLKGSFAAGLGAAWLMTFLDTVDGKLARTKLSSSKWGDVFDHGIDLVHPPFWYIAWGLGLNTVGLGWTPLFLWSVVAVILGGYVIQRLMEGIAIKWLGMEIHIWRQIDTWFREITARRNPNLILLTASVVAGRPDFGLLAVAAWTSICLLLHGIQLLQAFSMKRRMGRINSWMNESPSHQ